MSIKRTLRERKFIKAYIENSGNATKAFLILNPTVKRKNAKEYGYRSKVIDKYYSKETMSYKNLKKLLEREISDHGTSLNKSWINNVYRSYKI